MALTVREHMTIQLAAAPYRSPGRRLDDALDRVGMRPTQFWATVNRLLDQADALEAHPTAVHRLRRLQDARRRQRSPHRLSIGDRPS